MCVWYDWFMCVTWLIRVCGMTYSCVYVCDVTHVHGSWGSASPRGLSYGCIASCMCVAWMCGRTRLIHVCDMTYTHVSLRLCIAMWSDLSVWCLVHAYGVNVCDKTHFCAWHNSWLETLHCHVVWFMCVVQEDTGWRRLIGCLKLQVIFRKRATNYRALLRKMTCEDKAPYASTPSCTQIHTYLCHTWMIHDVGPEEVLIATHSCVHTWICMCVVYINIYIYDYVNEYIYDEHVHMYVYI